MSYNLEKLGSLLPRTIINMLVKPTKNVNHNKNCLSL